MFYDGVPSNTTEYTYDLTKVETSTATVNKFIARNATSQEKFEYDSYGIYFNVLSSGETEMIFVKEAGRTFGANDTTSSVSLFVKAYDATGMLIGTIKI